MRQVWTSARRGGHGAWKLSVAVVTHRSTTHPQPAHVHDGRKPNMKVKLMLRMTFSLMVFGVLSTPLAAQGRFVDPNSGFGLTVAAPFTVEPTSRRQFDVGAGVKSSTGRPPVVGTGQFICEAGFKAAAQNNSLTRQEINAFVQKPEWRKLARAAIELGFKVTAERTFMLDGFRGIEYQARPKSGPGANDVRTLMSIVETSKGRTTVLCLTDKRAFRTSLATFRTLRNGLTLPQ